MASFLDRDKDGKVTQRDFDIMLKQAGQKGIMPKMIGKMVFKALDRNGDGQLDSKEIKGINFKSLGIGKESKKSQNYQHEQNYSSAPHFNKPGSSQYSDYSNRQPGNNYNPQYNQQASFSNQGPSDYPSGLPNNPHASYPDQSSSSYPSAAPHNPYNDHHSGYPHHGPFGYPPAGPGINDHHPGYPTSGGGMPMPSFDNQSSSHLGAGYNAGMPQSHAYSPYDQNNNYPGYGGQPQPQLNQSYVPSRYPPPHNPYL